MSMREELEKMKDLYQSVEVLCTDIENLLNRIDDINRFKRDIKEEWEHLNKYYVEPLNDSYLEVQEAYLKIEM